MPLADRVVLITGATGDLGTVATRRFGEAGARLGLVGRVEARLTATARAAGLVGDRWAAGVGDVSQRDQAEAAVAAVTERLGPVDVLIHLVGGYAGGGPIASFADDDLHSMLGGHLWSTLHVTRAVVPGMTERGWGRVIAVSATATATTPPGLGAYTAAKSAGETLLRTLAREVSGSGVTVNVLVGRKIDTHHERETAPAPRNAPWSTPEEIAAAMLFLCSDDAATITGARIPLDGRT